MKTRVISAIVLLSIVAVCVTASPITRILLFLVAAVLSCYEMSNALKKTELKVIVFPAYLFIIGHAVMCYFDIDIILLNLWFFVMAVVSVCVAIISPKKFSCKDALATLSVLVYPLVPYALLIKFSLLEDWVAVFALACIATWVCDSFALFGGKLLGKHKIAPTVSPNKTVEGCISGAVFGALSGVAMYFALRHSFDIPLWICIVTALISSTAGQFGDLAASLVKRMAGLKDYSNLIPGHGGMLDRTDSLLFSIPTAYICLYLAGVLL